ncbi:hypothetical protein [Paenibacillus koleovorans]|uniref:hypothetical protein n=1 Tax=Paenibacillus koleovorans TaxID=121608 RepID=UPI000FD89030|nr:hypothetical protein [Paenibacillus koleovorans]
MTATTKTRLERWSDKAPGWMLTLLPMLAVTAGGSVLWAVWHFYYDNWNTGDLAWYNWIRPLFMTAFGLMNITAAPFLAFRKRIGWELLTLAYAIVPIVLMVGLVIVSVRFVWFLISSVVGRFDDLLNGTLWESLDFHPKQLTFLPLLIIVGLVVIGKLRGESNEKRGN